MEPIRLQKYLAHIGVGSRRGIEKMIVAKEITVNGKIAQLGDKVTKKDVICINGKGIKHASPEKKIIAFHKPNGVECTTVPSTRSKTLADFDFGPERMYPIGRLDKESRGLLLMTNNGELANTLTHPRYEHEKEYIVTVDQRVTPKILEQLSKGALHINGKTVKKADVEKLDVKVFKIILKEGRNRQIRKMCGALNLTVHDLLRVRIANITLDNLKAGDMRTVDSESLKV